MARNIRAGMRCEVVPSPFTWQKDYILPYVGEVVEITDRKVDTVFFRGPDGYPQSADESRFQPVDPYTWLGPKFDPDEDGDEA